MVNPIKAFAGLKTPTTQKEKKKGKVSADKSLRVFVSYSTNDKLLAGAIKNDLAHYGIDVFLAHEDITPSADWQSTILTSLKQTDVFIPLLTKSFKTSDWTDQETGIAVAEQKLIIPLKVDIDPYGFIAKVQAFKFQYNTSNNSDGSTSYFCYDSCLKIVELIVENKNLKENIKQGIINSFLKSRSFDSAADKAKLLEKFNTFSKGQVERIIEGSINNNQIYGSYGAIAFLKKFISTHERYIESPKKEELIKLLK